MKEVRKFSVRLPDGNLSFRLSKSNYKYAVIERTQEKGQDFTRWYVSRYSNSLINAEKYAKYLQTCPSARKGFYKFEIQVVQVEECVKETNDNPD